MANRMKRSDAREWAFKLIYEVGFNKDERLEDIYSLASGFDDFCDDEYIRRVFFGVFENVSSLDEAIEKNARGWSLSRISRVSLSIMRLCVYEMRCVEDVPMSVAINEAVELAKKYDTDAAPSFINGILNMIAKSEGLE